MITAVDTSVLLDVFGGDATYGPRSRDALRTCMLDGALVACDVVWAEVTAAFASEDDAVTALRHLGIDFAALDASAASAAGTAWRTYRQQGGHRDRVIADFLIAGHALVSADRLLTRDRGFFRAQFAELEVVDPTER